MGIPKTIVASGGVYTHNDGRDVPDVFQVVMEYPEFMMTTSQDKGKEKGMTFMYRPHSATSTTVVPFSWVTMLRWNLATV